MAASDTGPGPRVRLRAWLLARYAHPPFTRRQRRWLRLVALALVVLYAAMGCRAEEARTYQQVDILRDALADGSWDHQTKSRKTYYSGFSMTVVRGAWGLARVHRTPEQVLENLADASRAAGISPPLCVRLNDSKRADLVTRSPTRPGAKHAMYACEPIRHRRAFGWLLITSYGADEAGRPLTRIEYGLGPKAGGLRLSTRWPDG